jgi:hypothetical protein
MKWGRRNYPLPLMGRVGDPSGPAGWGDLVFAEIPPDKPGDDERKRQKHGRPMVRGRKLRFHFVIPGRAAGVNPGPIPCRQHPGMTREERPHGEVPSPVAVERWAPTNLIASRFPA